MSEVNEVVAIEPRVFSIVRGISGKEISEARKRPTATSLAALKIAGALSPAISAS